MEVRDGQRLFCHSPHHGVQAVSLPFYLEHFLACSALAPPFRLGDDTGERGSQETKDCLSLCMCPWASLGGSQSKHVEKCFHQPPAAKQHYMLCMASQWIFQLNQWPSQQDMKTNHLVHTVICLTAGKSHR